MNVTVYLLIVAGLFTGPRERTDNPMTPPVYSEIANAKIMGVYDTKQQCDDVKSAQETIAQADKREVALVCLPATRHHPGTPVKYQRD